MEINNDGNNAETEKAIKNWEAYHRRGKIVGGLIITAIGGLFLARELGAELPAWLFTWNALLIVIGLYIGIKHKFMHMGWIVPVIIGSAFLVGDIYPAFQTSHLLWPVVIIIAGIAMITKPYRRNNGRKHEKRVCDFHLELAITAKLPTQKYPEQPKKQLKARPNN